jgi:predicted nucleic acid-binding protein
MSVITLEEIQLGLAWRPNPRIRAWFETFVNYHCDVRAVTSEIATIAGRPRGQLTARGFPHTQADMFIAATAHVERLTQVTRVVSQFDVSPARRSCFSGSQPCGRGIPSPFHGIPRSIHIARHTS